MLNWLKIIFLPRTCSVEAEASVDKSRLRRLVLEHIKKCGELGCTDEEGQIATGIPGNSWRPARIQLEEMGEVGLTGGKRKNISGRNASVWCSAKYAKVVRSYGNQ